MGTRRWILWQGLITPSMERFIMGTSGNGFEFSGLILQAHEEAPYVVRYRIEVDAGWRTRNLEVELEDGGQRRLSLTADGEGNWSRDGQRLEQIAGCIDVDLEWSPSTNTLPIRRLGLAAEPVDIGRRRLGALSLARRRPARTLVCAAR